MAETEVIDVDVLDTRLTDDGIEWYCEWTKGGDPNRRILVNGDTPLDGFLEDVKKRLKGRKLGVLSLLAHGWGQWEYADKAMQKKVKLHGGFGMEFCKEGLIRETVDRFKALNGLFNSSDMGIKLMGCDVAAEYRFRVAPGGSFKDGFGKQLCFKLAEVTQTGIIASDSIQAAEIDSNPRTYRWGNDIRTIKSCVKFGSWEGNVWIFRPNRTSDKYKPDSR
jgi:hypothetical protein